MDVRIPALRAMINVVSGNEHQTQEMIDAGAIPALQSMMKIPQETIRKEAALIISNIAAGSLWQVKVDIY